MSALFSLRWRPRVANYQSNTFTRRQAIADGISLEGVRYRLKIGTFERVLGDGLRHKDDPVTPQMLAYSAHLTWPDTILCGPNVAALFGAPLQLDSADVVAPDNRKPRLRLTPHRTEILAVEVTTWRGIPITSLKCSLLDSFSLLPHDLAKSLFIWAFTKDKLAVQDIERHLAQFPGRRGNKRMRLYAHMGRQGVMSVAEAKAHKLLRQAGITGWQADVQIRDDQGILARADILFGGERLVIEIDGKQFHGADRFQKDRDRDNLLTSAGYLVMRFTWYDLTQRPRQMVHQIEEVLALRRRR